MKNKYFLNICAGWQQIESMQFIKNEGIKLISIDENSNSPGKNISDIFLNIKINNYDRIIDYLSNIKIKPIGIGSFVCNINPEIIYKLREIYGHDRLYSTKIFNTLDKLQIYKELKKVVNIPLIFEYEENIYENIDYILKPRYGSGSRSIIKTNKNALNKKENFIIQEYIYGEEFSVEVFCVKKLVTILLVSNRVVNNSFSADKIYISNNQDILKKNIYPLIKKIYKYYDFPQGPGHFEVIINSYGIYLIDLAFRGGGYEIFNFMVYKATGFNIIKQTVNLFLNRNVYLHDSYEVKKYVLLDYIRLKKFTNKFRFIQNKLKSDNILCKQFPKISSNNKNSDDSSRTGVIIVWADSYDECQDNSNKLRDNINSIIMK